MIKIIPALAAVMLAVPIAAVPAESHAEIWCKDGYRYIGSVPLKDADGFATLFTVDTFKNTKGTRIGIDTRGGRNHDTYQKLYKGGKTLKSSRGHEDTGCITYPLSKIKPNRAGWRVVGVYASASAHGVREASVKFKIRSRL